MPEIVWTPKGIYRRVDYENEQDLESAIEQVKEGLFGPHRIYLNLKKKIGRKNSQRNIPDGYLIDLSGDTPRLFVVENELERHDPLRHIAAQILEFSLSFESEPLLILFDALQANPDAKLKCEGYAAQRHYRNLDYLLEYLVTRTPFTALVIIDSIPDNLQKILDERFKFGTEVIKLVRYQNSRGEKAYHFEPFLADIDTDQAYSVDLGEIDTVVVPAREEGFRETFLGEHCWYAVRIHGTIRPQLKWIAAYQIRPISAITYVAPIRAIEPYGDEGKSIIYFSEPAQALNPPIPMNKNGKIKSFQNLRYTTRDRLEQANTLDDVFVR